MSGFKDRFQVYSNALFLMFDLENKLQSKLREKLFTIYLSKDYYIENKGERYYVPVQIKVDKNRLNFDEYFKILDYIPAFQIQLGSRSKIELTTAGIYNCSLDIKVDLALKDKLREENRKLFGMVGGSVSDDLKSILQEYDYEFREVDGNIVIDEMKIVITRQSLILLPTEFDDYDVISENVKIFYTSINTKLKQNQGACKSLGYFMRKNKTVIDQNMRQHLAIIDKTIHDIM